MLMLTGPIPRPPRFARAGVSIEDVDAIEINEAFASVPLAWQAEFGVPEDRLNPRGGAIALGHPLGASGARLMTTMINHLEATGGRLGLQTMCEAGGMAMRPDRTDVAMDLTGGSVVVTGGASGLGLATVQALAAQGRGSHARPADPPARTWRSPSTARCSSRLAMSRTPRPSRQRVGCRRAARPAFALALCRQGRHRACRRARRQPRVAGDVREPDPAQSDGNVQHVAAERCPHGAQRTDRRRARRLR